MAGIWNPLRGMREQKQRAEALYKGLMAAALSPEAYVTRIVPDDMDHRVQMVALHAALLTWQMPLRKDKALRQLPQLIHAFVFDGFDAALRETGVGDASIARRVRKMGEHYYGLGTSAAKALSAGYAERESSLRELLRRNGVTSTGREDDLARHFAVLAEAFEAAPSEAFLAGEAPWQPYPATSRRGVAKA